MYTASNICFSACFWCIWKLVPKRYTQNLQKTNSETLIKLINKKINRTASKSIHYMNLKTKRN